jgi:hypothetical protein
MDAPNDEQPDPMSEPDAGPAAGGRASATEASEKASNAEVVLDPDSAGQEPERDAEAQVERLERHNRPTFPSGDESARDDAAGQPDDRE